MLLNHSTLFAIMYLLKSCQIKSYTSFTVIRFASRPWNKLADKSQKNVAGNILHFEDIHEPEVYLWLLASADTGDSFQELLHKWKPHHINIYTHFVVRTLI